MAQVFQLIATDRNHRHFEEVLADDTWHVSLRRGDGRTLCGVQMDGEDGIGPGPCKNGPVTCPICRGTIEEIQAIKDWE